MAGSKPVATQCLLKTKISGEQAESGLPQYTSNVRPLSSSRLRLASLTNPFFALGRLLNRWR